MAGISILFLNVAHQMKQQMSGEWLLIINIINYLIQFIMKTRIFMALALLMACGASHAQFSNTGSFSPSNSSSNYLSSLDDAFSYERWFCAQTSLHKIGPHEVFGFQ